MEPPRPQPLLLTPLGGGEHQNPAPRTGRCTAAWSVHKLSPQTHCPANLPASEQGQEVVDEELFIFWAEPSGKTSTFQVHAALRGHFGICGPQTLLKFEVHVDVGGPIATRPC